MKKLFICLANSKKYGERCIAGIEVVRKSNGNFRVVKKEGKPKWIRPVTDLEFGAVPEELVKTTQLLDVYEIDIIRACPKGYQSENVRFRLHSLKKVDTLGANNKSLFILSEKDRPTLFSNKGKAIPEEKIGGVGYSLVLIKAENAEIYVRNYKHGRQKIRIRFNYKDSPYDLPITDKDFLNKYKIDSSIFDEATNIYITVSLGILLEGWYYKLAAGIICLTE